MHDYPAFNTVWLDSKGFVTGFDANAKNHPSALSCLAFTGIQMAGQLVGDPIVRLGGRLDVAS